MDQHLIRTLTKIFMAGLKAVDPEAAVHRHVDLAGDRLRVGEHIYPPDSFKRIIVTGAGKGTAPMARALEDILGERLTTGWIIVKYGHGLPLKKIAVFEAGHPVPDPGTYADCLTIINRYGLDDALPAATVKLLRDGADGTDGPTDAAGAMVDGDTCRKARQRGRSPGDYLADNDSYRFFDQLGGLFKTGPTRTNVMDLMCLLVDKRPSHR